MKPIAEEIPTQEQMAVPGTFCKIISETPDKFIATFSLSGLSRNPGNLSNLSNPSNPSNPSNLSMVVTDDTHVSRQHVSVNTVMENT